MAAKHKQPEKISEHRELRAIQESICTNLYAIRGELHDHNELSRLQNAHMECFLNSAQYIEQHLYRIGQVASQINIQFAGTNRCLFALREVLEPKAPWYVRARLRVLVWWWNWRHKKDFAPPYDPVKIKEDWEAKNAMPRRWGGK